MLPVEWELLDGYHFIDSENAINLLINFGRLLSYIELLENIILIITE